MSAKFRHIHIKGHSIGVILVFLLLAMGFWMGDKLTGEFETDLKIEISLKDYNLSNMIFSTDVLHLIVHVRGSGMVILKYYFKPHRIQIPFDKVFPLKDNSKRYGIPSVQLKQLVEEQLKEIQVLSIVPEIVYFETKKIIQKKLPVQLNIWLNYKEQYFSTSSRISPDSVWITGPENSIDTMTRVTTRYYSAKSVNKNMRVDLNLELAQNVTANVKKIQYTNTVQRYTQNSIRLPIQLLDVKSGVRLKIIPTHTTILYKVAMNEIRTVPDTLFELGVKYEDVLKSKSGLVKVHVLKSPIPIKSITLVDPYVEFIHFTKP